MATIVRKDIASEPAPWSDAIVWYAVGVHAMMQRPITAAASWWSFAAIHGQDIAADDPGMPGWYNIIAPPSIVWGSFDPKAPYPITWDQCQHGTWYFPPWHRGYLMALEAQLQADISAAGGPSGWALPYWNYWASGGNLPVEFTQKSLPTTTASGAPFPAGLGGQPNPLYVTMRYGQAELPDISPACLANTVYTGPVRSSGFGGGPTPFSHFGRSTGDLENNPHNIVHGQVGSQEPTAPNYLGLMADPVYASLDPIFFLHHGMIDALWSYWNAPADGSNPNPTDAKWLTPSFPTHPGMFLMPWESAGAGVTWHYLPTNVTSLAALQVTLSDGSTVPYSYTYDFLANPGSAVYPFNKDWSPTSAATDRLNRLGLNALAAAPEEPPVSSAELLGASAGAHAVANEGTEMPVEMDPGTRNRLESSMKNASGAAPADRVLLQLDGVTGTSGASALRVMVHGPGGTKRHIGTAGLFGLGQASRADSLHGGSGLSFGFDITDLADELHLAHGLDAGKLTVSVEPTHPMPAGRTITVGRVSVHRLAH